MIYVILRYWRTYHVLSQALNHCLPQATCALLVSIGRNLKRHIAYDIDASEPKPLMDYAGVDIKRRC